MDSITRPRINGVLPFLEPYDSLLKKEGEGVAVFFSCFDQQLNHAAETEGLVIHKELERICNTYNK